MARSDYRNRDRIRKMQAQPERWKRHQRWCETERGYHNIITLGGGDFYSGLMALDFIHAQIRAFVEQSREN